jgi:isocitrate/isopropylmalate dehydrogenase
MAEHLGAAGAVRRIETVVKEALEAGETTPDLGGTRGTLEVGEWIANRLRRG